MGQPACGAPPGLRRLLRQRFPTASAVGYVVPSLTGLVGEACVLRVFACAGPGRRRYRMMDGLYAHV